MVLQIGIVGITGIVNNNSIVSKIHIVCNTVIVGISGVMGNCIQVWDILELYHTYKYTYIIIIHMNNNMHIII